MPSISDLNSWKQVQYQPLYGTDFFFAGATPSGNENTAMGEKNLFDNQKSATSNRSNVPAGGKLPGNQTFRLFTVQVEQFFTTVGGVAAGMSTLRGVAELSLAHLHSTAIELDFTEMQVIKLPITMAPAGAGPWGFISDSTRPLITNGAPESPAKYVFPKDSSPVIEQNATLKLLVKRESIPTSSGSIDVASEINSFTGLKLCRIHLGGIKLRSATGAV